ncbi:MAG TPA: V-type ATPase 116kDa subunit family protein [Kofleriaceae bacterium]|nr:V-type ATPase 116kDa subunit family protein [Kofleriaceae bacterium]
MTRVRVLGPRAALEATVRALQDAGVVHLIDAERPPGLERHEPDARARRRRHHVERALTRVEGAIDALARLGARVDDTGGALGSEGHASFVAARTLAIATGLRAREAALADERDALRAYAPLFEGVEALLTPRVSIYLLQLRTTAARDALAAALDRAIDGEHELRTHAMTNGQTAALLLVPTSRADAIERHLAAVRIERAPLPAALGDAGANLADVMPRLRPRLAELDRALDELHADARAIARTRGELLARARRAFHDALIGFDAAERAADSPRAFVLEGWLPARDRERLHAALAAVGPEVACTEIDRASWRSDDAPVVLTNPRVFAPFEALTSLLPLPRYGTVDPTPFVAVFFPMFFGVVVGDVGYGLIMIAIAILLRVLTRAGSAGRTVAKIAVAVALYTILFGLLYGEAFGDLGARALGLEPLWFDRREAVLGFLALAVALGLVHLVLGLVVAAINRWRRDRREAIGRGLTAVMLVLVAVALLALFDRVPSGLLTPSVIALLIALPIVVVLEGATALLDFMTILGHVLSYARVMALGTASVMLAVVANQMYGAFGSAAIGVAFALVFHLVNFAITLFSPTIHVMRLHYVEFFGTFFEPGGGPYRPLAHWSPSAT